MARVNGTSRPEGRYSAGSDDERRNGSASARPAGENGGDSAAPQASRRNLQPENRLDLSDLKFKTINELLALSKQMGVEGVSGLKKQDMIFELLKAQTERNGLIFSSGVLEILSDGYGFLRSPNYNYLPGPDDIYVSPSQIRL
ncbi:MAG TPA: Rho termination factor N-terminal domain-containing protein, partial [Spirochaetota bacterium]|nr:Rho termination factor N-terminal domain-containing protein [Spirochaetota bacterium]